MDETMMPRNDKLKILAAVLIFLVAISSSGRANAQSPVLEMQSLPCVSNTDNALINVQATNVEQVREMRTYFRWNERANFYYVVMAADGPGKFWSLLPKPEERNEMIEVYITALDAAGETLGKSATTLSEVTEECENELTERQRGYADNLVVGETAATQLGNDVLGFLCDGVVTRIGPDGVLRADDVCRACVIGAASSAPPVQSAAAGGNAGTIAGVILGGAGVITTIVAVDDDDPPERSPSRP